MNEEEQRPPFTTVITAAPFQRGGEPDPLPSRYAPQIAQPGFQGGQEPEPQRPVFAPQIPQPGFRRGAEPAPLPPAYAPQIATGGFQRSKAPDLPVSSVEITQWLGMFSNSTPHSLGNRYLAYQENVMSVLAGQIEVRSGMRKVLFDIGA